MDRSLALLQHALSTYDLSGDEVVIEKILTNIYHSDDHFKIRIGNKAYSARFIKDRNRYEHDVFVPLTDAVLTEQMRFTSFLNQNGIPFMRCIPTTEGNDFLNLTWEGTQYLFLLFEWIEGQHITHCTESVAYTFGVLARKLHTLGTDYVSTLPQVSHREGSIKFLSILENAVNFTTNDCKALLSTYLSDAKKYIDLAFKSNNREFIMHSDLNPLNILWDDSETIIGIVDFEHIGYTERVEGLAWLIKWYSRTKGLASHEVSPQLAKSLLVGYGADEYLLREDWDRIPALLWLTGCLNWGFVDKTLRILNKPDPNMLELDAHLTKYLERGNKLSTLV
jgi:Ser/Thr protein kinase RdoA (MazF antagonist)